MPRDDRKDHCQHSRHCNTDSLDPQCPHEQEFADIRLSNPNEPEGRRLGLLQEGEQGRERVECREEQICSEEEREYDLGLVNTSLDKR